MSLYASSGHLLSGEATHCRGEVQPAVRPPTAPLPWALGGQLLHVGAPTLARLGEGEREAVAEVVAGVVSGQGGGAEPGGAAGRGEGEGGGAGAPPPEADVV